MVRYEMYEVCRGKSSSKILLSQVASKNNTQKFKIITSIKHVSEVSFVVEWFNYNYNFRISSQRG